MKPRSQIRSAERGYIMMTLLLVMALMAIFAAVIVSSVTFDIKRDREEEMIHRGVQYSRAIRAYYKKFSRYPAKIEDLENTNQMRFLRKRYKDPLTGKDFKLLHYGEAKMSMNALGGGIAGAATLGANGSLNTPGGMGQSPLGQPSTFGSSGGFGASSTSAFGQNSQQNNQTATGTQSGSDPNAPASTDATNGTTAGPGGTSSGGSTGTSGDKLSGTTFGGAPIVGVASLSKDRTIREFDHKKKYDEWQFVYDPTMDRGFLITTPYQQQLQGFGAQGNVNGQNGQPGGQNGTSGFGNSLGNGFGNSPSPMQNNPTSPNGGGFGNSSQPSSPPQQ
jgi:type II secretory pathway pseudopilin PulG